MTLRVIFAGSSEFAVPSLRGLLDSDVDLLAVITRPDRPKGRGRKLTATVVKQAAAAEGLPIMHADRTTPALTDDLAALNPDVIVVVAFGLLLPQNVLKLPVFGCINVHASLLPRWRGAAPVARSIEAGDRTTGVTVMRMDEGLDTGSILAQKSIPIRSHDTTFSLQQKLSELGAEALTECLKNLPDRLASSVAQNNDRATYANKMSKTEASIDWQLSARDIVQKIHACNPWPVAKTCYDGHDLYLWTAELVSETENTGQPGEVLESTSQVLKVQAGLGSLRILTLQRAGKRCLEVRDFVAGFAIPVNSRFE